MVQRVPAPSQSDYEKWIIASMPGIMYWVDNDATLLGCNTHLIHMLGLSSMEEFVGLDATQFARLIGWTNAQLETFKHDNAEIIKTATAKLFEESITINGKNLTFLTHRAPLYNTNNEIIGVIHTSTDITHQNKSNHPAIANDCEPVISAPDANNTKAYAESIRHYLESIIACMPGHVYWTDKNSVYLGCNDNAAKYFGLKSRSEVVGLTYKNMAELGGWTEGQEMKFQRDDWEVMQSGKPKLNVEEPPITDTEGRTTHFLTSRVPIRNTKNQITGIVGISMDITERKKMEEELFQTKVAKTAAELANQAKSEFIANMSHDIRTPITGILGLIEELIYISEDTQALLKQTPPTSITDTRERYVNLYSQLNQFTEKVQEDGHLLLGSTDELLQLLNEILETMRLESGKEPETTESFNLRELIEHNIELMLPVAQHKKLSISCEMDEVIPTYVSGLRHYLDRTLLNLLSNALKFTKEGFVKIRVQFLAPKQAHAVDDTIQLQISVEDSGIGIPEDKFETIFEHFSRLTPAYQGLYKGAGLGLYTVKHYIKAMNADIKVESEINKGTRFIMTIPFVVSDHTDREKNSYRIATAKRPLIQMMPATNKTSTNTVVTILIVEDNWIAAKAVQTSIARLYSNCVCEVASTGKQAVEMASQKQYSLILMDVGLPDIEGTEATQQIRALENTSHAHVPIVALTGYGSDLEKRKEALAAGMQEIFLKPLRSSDLELLLQNYVIKPAEDNSNNTVEQILDWDKSLEKLSGDEACLRELLAELLLILQVSQEKLATDYANHDNEALRAELHKVRGGIAYLELPQLDKAFANFHAAVKATPQDPEQLEQLYNQLQQAIKIFEEYAKKMQF